MNFRYCKLELRAQLIEIALLLAVFTSLHAVTSLLHVAQCSKVTCNDKNSTNNVSLQADNGHCLECNGHFMIEMILCQPAMNRSQLAIT